MSEDLHRLLFLKSTFFRNQRFLFIGSYRLGDHFLGDHARLAFGGIRANFGLFSCLFDVDPRLSSRLDEVGALVVALEFYVLVGWQEAERGVAVLDDGFDVVDFGLVFSVECDGLHGGLVLEQE